MNWLTSRRSRFVQVTTLIICLISPSVVWAGNWGEDWGVMLWEAIAGLIEKGQKEAR